MAKYSWTSLILICKWPKKRVQCPKLILYLIVLVCVRYFFIMYHTSSLQDLIFKKSKFLDPKVGPFHKTFTCQSLMIFHKSIVVASSFVFISTDWQKIGGGVPLTASGFWWRNDWEKNFFKIGKMSRLFYKQGNWKLILPFALNGLSRVVSFKSFKFNSSNVKKIFKNDIPFFWLELAHVNKISSN